MTSIKVLHQGTIRFVEARFYFRAIVEGIEESLALCSLYSLTDEHHRGRTHGALIVCDYEGERTLVVIRAKSILSVVGMMPFKDPEQDEGGRQFYLVEKFGLGVVDTGDIID
jgi:hypothetical protein